MGTTDEPFDVSGYLAKGKKLAAAAIVAVAFAQSVYAAFFKEAEEAVAKDTYQVQKTALEEIVF